MAGEIDTPVVFISYSHDSPEHKRWVSELASRLRASGVDVKFDQWDLRFGDDVPKFMERSVRESHRVLMICTDAYVRKANEGVGGVGYEAMIVTGELIKDLGTAKFIPIVRQDSLEPIVPTALTTRFFVDFGKEGTFEAEFDRLLRELHKVPPPDKPPLGKNPFAITPSGDEIPVQESAPAPILTIQSPQFSSPEEAYEAARSAIITGDVVQWRSVVRRARQFSQLRLAQWSTDFKNKQTQDHQTLIAETRQGTEAFAPLIAVALAAVSSGREKYLNQISLLEEVLNPAEWNRSGLVVRTELPQAAGFLYQALHGAICLYTAQLPVAIQLVRNEISLPGERDSLAVGRAHTLMGWPNSFGRDSTKAWQVLMDLPQHWSWLMSVFGDSHDYKAAMTAYYMSLNINEYAFALAQNQEDTFAPGKIGLDIPTHFASQPEDIQRPAYRLLTQNTASVREIWSSLGVADIQAKQHWSQWLLACQYWHQKLYPFGNGFTEQYKQLVNNVTILQIK